MRVVFSVLAGTTAQRSELLRKLRALNFVDSNSASSANSAPSLLLHASNKSVGVEVGDAPKSIFAWLRKSRDLAVDGIRFEGGRVDTDAVKNAPPLPRITFVPSVDDPCAKGAPAGPVHVIQGVKEVVLPVGSGSDTAAKVRSYLLAHGATEKMHGVFEQGGTHYRLLPTSNAFSMSFLVGDVAAAGEALKTAMEDNQALGRGLVYSYLAEGIDVRLDSSREVLPFFREGHYSVLEGALRGAQSEGLWGGGSAAGLRTVSDDCWGEVKEMVRTDPVRFLTETRAHRKPRQGSYLE